MTNKIIQELKRLIWLIFSFLLFLTITSCHASISGLLNPKGLIAWQERQLLFNSTVLMLIVVVPVIVMSFAFVIRYRQKDKTADYKPNWENNIFLEVIWWGVPFLVILILGIMTWNLTHKLDPFRKINIPGKPLLIEAVALPWKWLFIYPQQNIATVNFIEIPKNKQVEFWLTSDNVPMSAFFIPQLGSQVYTMAGMRTRLHLVGSQIGTYQGLNSQYNGDGFSDMHFNVKVVEPNEMQACINKVKQSSKKLTLPAYRRLTQPTVAASVEYYSSVEPRLFKSIICKYHQIGKTHGHGNL